MSAREILGRQFHGALDTDFWGHEDIRMVPPDALVPYRDHDGTRDGDQSRAVVESLRADLRGGGGFRNPITVSHDDDWGFISEGNHRLAAALAENVPVVPVRTHRAEGGASLEIRKERRIGAPYRPLEG